jgi:hypothetical protein
MLCRAPSQLEEAAASAAGAKSGDDGRVQRGRTEKGVAGQGGRWFSLVTGFPFPLGPLFSRQTVRYEVRARMHALIQAPKHARCTAGCGSRERNCLRMHGLRTGAVPGWVCRWCRG